MLAIIHFCFQLDSTVAVRFYSNAGERAAAVKRVDEKDAASNQRREIKTNILYLYCTSYSILLSFLCKFEIPNI